MGYEFVLLVALVAGVVALILVVITRGQTKQLQRRVEEMERRQWGSLTEKK